MDQTGNLLPLGDYTGVVNSRVIDTNGARGIALCIEHHSNDDGTMPVLVWAAGDNIETVVATGEPVSGDSQSMQVFTTRSDDWNTGQVYLPPVVRVIPCLPGKVYVQMQPQGGSNFFNGAVYYTLIY